MENKTESELYAAQMEHWFDEHNRIGDQLKRTIAHYEELAGSNRNQLKLHERRLEMAETEYNIWANENGLPVHGA